MIKQLMIVLLAIVCLGCELDGARQYSLQYPAKLVVKNSGTSVIQIKSISSTFEVSGGVILNGFELQPDTKVSLDISEESYNIIKQLAFVVDGACGSLKDWTLKGGEVNLTVESEWVIKFNLHRC